MIAIPARGDRHVLLVDQPFDYVYGAWIFASGGIPETAWRTMWTYSPYYEAIDDFFITSPTMIDRATFTMFASEELTPPWDYNLRFFREADSIDWPDTGIGVGFTADSITPVEQIRIDGYSFQVYEVVFEDIDFLLEPGHYWASVFSVTSEGTPAGWGTSGAGTPLNGHAAYWRDDLYGDGVWRPAHEQGIGLEGPTDLAMTIEGTVLADPGVVAELLDFEVVEGELIVGTLEQIEASDNGVIATRSERALTGFEPNVMEIVVGAASPFEPADATTIDVTIESNMVNGQFMGEAKVRLRNWQTDTFEQVAVYDIYSHEERVMVDDIDAAHHIRERDGRIEVSIRHVAMAIFFEEGFEPHFDEVEVRVHER